MSSGFTSGGTNEAPIQRSDEWLAAQLEIEANRARKAAEARQHDGKSLFETLEANKGTSFSLQTLLPQVPSVVEEPYPRSRYD